MKSTRITQGSPNKIQNKLIKYKKGDCISILCDNGLYMAALISQKFNKYYDITVIEYRDKHKPSLDDIMTKRFYGTKVGSLQNLTYAVNVQMITCQYIDGNSSIELIGSIELIDNFTKDGYAYLDTVEELEKFYLDELSIRIQKTENAEKFPEIGFGSIHLINIKSIIK